MFKNKRWFIKLKRHALAHVRIIRAIILGLILTIVILLGIFIYRALSRSIVGVSIGLARDFIFPSSI